MALLVTAAVAAYPTMLGSRAATISELVGSPAVLLVLTALLGVWDDGLVAGPSLLLAAYIAALALGHHAVDPFAPLVVAALVAVIDVGNWSLELRDGREAPPLHHLRTLLALALGAAAVSALVLAAGALHPGGGIAWWFAGAAAAAALLTLLRRAARRTTVQPPADAEDVGSPR